jgi:hypothetical protein
VLLDNNDYHIRFSHIRCTAIYIIQDAQAAETKAAAALQTLLDHFGVEKSGSPRFCFDNLNSDESDEDAVEDLTVTHPALVNRGKCVSALGFTRDALRQLCSSYVKQWKKDNPGQSVKSCIIQVQYILLQFLTDPRYVMFTDMRKLAAIYLVSTPTTAVVERGFSAMNAIEPETRSSLTQEHLNALMMCRLVGPTNIGTSNDDLYCVLVSPLIILIWTK